MNKIMLALILAGAAASAQAEVSLISDVAEASAAVTATNGVTVSNSLTPSTDVQTGDEVISALLATGSLTASDGGAHSYAITFPDDIIDSTRTTGPVVANVTGVNNPDNKLQIVLGSVDSIAPVNGDSIDGKRYLLLENREGSASVDYAVRTPIQTQTVKPDTYNIRTQAYIYAK